MKPYMKLSPRGMIGQTNVVRRGRGAIVKSTITGTQFHQLIKRFCVFILVGVDLSQFVADVAPHFADFDKVGAPIRTLHQFLDWTANVDWAGQVSPASSEGSRARGSSLSSGTSVSSSKGGLLGLMEDNDALSPCRGELERERRSMDDANYLAAASPPSSLLSVFEAHASSAPPLPV